MVFIDCIYCQRLYPVLRFQKKFLFFAAQKKFAESISSLLLLLLLSHFSRVRLCATPSLGFSRQEHWSGLLFPSPMHESEKWKWSCSVMSDSSWPHGLQPTRLLHPWDFPGKSTEVGWHCLLKLVVLVGRNKTILYHQLWDPQKVNYEATDRL